MAVVTPRNISQLSDYPTPRTAEEQTLCLDESTGLFYWSGGMPTTAEMDAANVGDVLTLQAGKRKFLPTTPTGGSTFPLDGEYSNPVNDYSCAGVYTEHTLVVEATAGNTYIDLTSTPTDYVSGNGIVIPGAGVAGVDLKTSVLSRAGNRLNLNTDIKTTVASGATVYHDDTVGLQNWLDDGNLFTGVMGANDFIVTDKLDFTKAGTAIQGIQAGMGPILYPAIKAGYSGTTFNGTAKEVISRDIRRSAIWDRSTTGNTLNIGSNDCAVMGLIVASHHATVKTSGSMIAMGIPGDIFEGGTSPTEYVSGTRIREVGIGDCYEGLRVQRGFSLRVNDFSVRNYNQAGIIQESDYAYGGFKFSHLRLTATKGTIASNKADASCGPAVKITGSDLNQWFQIDTWRCQDVFSFQPTLDHINKQLIWGFGIDNHGGTAFNFGTSGANVVQGCRISGGTVNTSASVRVYNFGSKSQSNYIGNYSHGPAGPSSSNIDVGTSNVIDTASIVKLI